MEDVALLEDDVYEAEQYDDDTPPDAPARIPEQHTYRQDMVQTSRAPHAYASDGRAVSHNPGTSAGRQQIGTAPMPGASTAQQHPQKLPSTTPATRQPWRSAPIDSQEEDMAREPEVKRTRVHDH